jgi:hypothetical protein
VLIISHQLQLAVNVPTEDKNDLRCREDGFANRAEIGFAIDGNCNSPRIFLPPAVVPLSHYRFIFALRHVTTLAKNRR